MTDKDKIREKIVFIRDAENKIKYIPMNEEVKDYLLKRLERWRNRLEDKIATKQRKELGQTKNDITNSRSH